MAATDARSAPEGPGVAPGPMAAAAREARLDRLLLTAATLLAGLVAFGLTRSTMLPGIDFWDTAEFQTVAAVLGAAHPTGYPSYTLLGWLSTLVLGPLGEPAARLNLLSGLLLATGAGLAVVVVRLIGGRTFPALAAGILLALTPWPWQIGSFADPHMLHLVFVAALLLALVGWESRRAGGDPRADRWLVGASVLYGLSLGNHQLTLLLAPGIALFLLAVDRRIFRRRALVSRCAGALFGTAALVYLELPIRAAMGAPLVYGHPETPLGFLYVALGVQFAGDVGGPFADLGGKLGDLVGIAIAQFGVLAALIPAAFVALAVRRPRIALLTGTWVGVTCLFAASYDNAMISRYYLGPILCVVVWLGAGAAILVDAALILRAVTTRAGTTPAATTRAGTTPAATTRAGTTRATTRAGGGAGGAAGGGGGAAGGGGGAAGGGGATEAAAGRGTARSARGDEANVATDESARGGRPAAAGRDWFPVRLAFIAAALLVTPAIWYAPGTFAAVDRRHDVDAARWSGWVFATAEPDAVLVTWWSYSTTLWYRRLVLGERRDIQVVDDRDREDEGLGSVDDVIRANLASRPVYVVRDEVDLLDLESRWQLDQIADPGGTQPLYRVTGPRPQGGSGIPGGASGIPGGGGAAHVHARGTAATVRQ